MVRSSPILSLTTATLFDSYLFAFSWQLNCYFFCYYYWFPRTRRPRIAFLSNSLEVGSFLYDWMVLISVLAPSFFFPQSNIIIRIIKESILEFQQQCDFLVNLPAHASVNLQVAKVQLHFPVVGFRKTMLFVQRTKCRSKTILTSLVQLQQNMPIMEK